MNHSASTRRALIDRWIARLTPMLRIIDIEAANLRLPGPRPFGPTYFPRQGTDPEHIRTGTVWWITGYGNSGYHVDFYATALRIEAWTGRHLHAEITHNGQPGPATLQNTLRRVLAFAGLTDLNPERPPT